MAFQHFPFAEFLEPKDCIIIFETLEHEIAIVPAKELIAWYPHSCNCTACEVASQALDKFLIGKGQRETIIDFDTNVVFFDKKPLAQDIFMIKLIIEANGIIPL